MNEVEQTSSSNPDITTGYYTSPGGDRFHYAIAGSKKPEVLALFHHGLIDMQQVACLDAAGKKHGVQYLSITRPYYKEGTYGKKPHLNTAELAHAWAPLLHEFGFTRERIGMLGFSAGGLQALHIARYAHIWESVVSHVEVVAGMGPLLHNLKYIPHERIRYVASVVARMPHLTRFIIDHTSAHIAQKIHTTLGAMNGNGIPDDPLPISPHNLCMALWSEAQRLAEPLTWPHSRGVPSAHITHPSRDTVIAPGGGEQLFYLMRGNQELTGHRVLDNTDHFCLDAVADEATERIRILVMSQYEGFRKLFPSWRYSNTVSSPI